MNPNKSEPRLQSESIRINLSLDWIKPSSGWFRLKTWFWLVWIHSDWCTDLSGLSRILFWTIPIKRDAKRFSHWFCMTRNSSETDSAMALIRSIYNFSPILSSGCFPVKMILKKLYFKTLTILATSYFFVL